MWAWRTLAMIAVTALAASAAWQASIDVDGSRYFFLDDDQMVAMRYGRNLAEGFGPVWNPGERVEGYTSPAWMAVMALVHSLGADDMRASLWVKCISWSLALAVLLLSERLLRRLHPATSAAAAGTLLLTLALCTDLLFWAVNGFETTLLTAVTLAALLLVARDAETRRFRALTAITIGLIPLARSDGWLLMSGVLAAACGMVGVRDVVRQLPLCLVLPLTHLWWRHSYYGDWLPNTYYLKVVGVENLTWRGLGHVKGFGLTYGAAFAAAAAWLLQVERARARWRWMVAPVAAIVLHVTLVGPDMFNHFRFLAPVVPLLLVLAIGGVLITSADRSPPRMLLLAMLFVATTAAGGVTGLQGVRLLVSTNGLPFEATVAAHLIRHHTSEEATVAVVAAGVVPYFSRRQSIDLLGKTDAATARLPFRRGAALGHGKFDLEAAFARQPDVIVPHWSAEWAIDPEATVRLFTPDAQTDIRTAIALSPTFNRHYRSNRVKVPYLQAHHAVFVRDTSPERDRIAAWREPEVSR